MGRALRRVDRPDAPLDSTPVAYRAYLQRVPVRARGRKAPAVVGCPKYILVLDTETTTDATQRLLFGSWRYGYRDQDGTFICLDEGLLYADDLPQTDPDGFWCLEEYARAHAAHTHDSRRSNLQLRSRREFVNDQLWMAIDGGALIVGFNLPFDLTRLAVDCGAARGPKFRGGFAVQLFEYFDRRTNTWQPNAFRPWFRFKSLDSKRALMGLTRRRGAPPEEQKQTPEALGRFLDLKTLVFALTDTAHSLESAAEAFGLTAQKLVVAQHGRITSEYIAYNRQDVALTVELLGAALAEWDRHPLALSPDRVMSPASLAKGYLRALGVTPPAVKFADVPPELLGAAMTAYYGGRSEVRVRRTPVPIVYLDFLSMYPTVNARLGMWPLLIAERLAILDVTREVQQIGDTLTMQQCLSPEFWRGLCFFAKVRPVGDIVPVRAEYDPASPGMSIGVNPFWSDEPIWVAGPDLIASWLLTGHWPDVVEAVRVTPLGQEQGLKPVALRGRVLVDPAKEDFFRRVIEARNQIKRDRSLPVEERQRLERFLKVIANSGAYGVYAELNVQPSEQEVGDDVLIYGRETVFPVRTTAPEEPGEYSFPPFAALTTAGARLMLALLERCVRDAGGVIAFGDTDSAAIVALPNGGLVPCEGGPHRLRNGTAAVRALSWDDVERIRQCFVPLNPYDPDAVAGSILKLEDVNRADDGQQRVLYAFAISAKRYALFVRDGRGSVNIVDPKQHGLGHLRNPIDLDAEDREWIRTTWEALVREALGEPLVWPSWVDRPAAGRVTVSTPEMLRTYDALNAGKCYAERIKPTNFALSVSVAALAHPIGIDPERFHLLGAYEKDPVRWREMDWYDKYSGRPFKIGVAGEASLHRIQVNTYRDVLMQYRVHPEPKSLGPDGQPCHRATVGLLSRRPIRAGVGVYIGKESNRLEDVVHGLVHNVGEVRATYVDACRDPWVVDVVPFLRRLPRRDLARRAQLTPRTVQAARNGGRPSAKTRSALIRVALECARHVLRSKGADPDLQRLAEQLLRSSAGVLEREDTRTRSVRRR